MATYSMDLQASQASTSMFVAIDHQKLVEEPTRFQAYYTHVLVAEEETRRHMSISSVSGGAASYQ